MLLYRKRSVPLFCENAHKILRLLLSSLALVSVCSWSFNSVSPRLLNSSVARAVGASALSVLRFPVPVLTSKLQAVVAWFESSSLEFIWLVFLPRRCSLVSTQFYCCLNSFNGYCLKPSKNFLKCWKPCVLFSGDLRFLSCSLHLIFCHRARLKEVSGGWVQS